MKVLIIGLGSIAKKHMAALKQVRPGVAFWALRSSSSPEELPGVKNIEAVEECPDPDFVIVSNPTANHFEAIQKVLHLQKPIFLEKPPFHDLEKGHEALGLLDKRGVMTYTAFNLRFLDCLNYLKENVNVRKVQEVNVYCGSYLPEWRNTDYKKSYSAHSEMGGG